VAQHGQGLPGIGGRRGGVRGTIGRKRGLDGLAGARGRARARREGEVRARLAGQGGQAGEQALGLGLGQRLGLGRRRALRGLGAGGRAAGEAHDQAGGGVWVERARARESGRLGRRLRGFLAATATGQRGREQRAQGESAGRFARSTL
jgi:hypothetical protein